MINYGKHQLIEPSKRFRKPMIIDAKISVSDVLNWLLKKYLKKKFK
jgi:uncharacterized protein (DUF433 family)